MTSFEAVAASAPPALDEKGQLVPRRTVSRRSMLLGALGTLGAAAALSVVDLFANGRRAFASLNEYTTCANYDTWSGYDNNTEACVGAPYSLWYCGSNGWFKNGWSDGYYWQPVKACGTGGLTKRNAWRWTHSGITYRCADGTRTTYGQSTPTFLICRQRL